MKKRTMLLVEDNADTRNVTTRLLQTNGWIVEVAVTGNEALKKLREVGSTFDVVVLDLRMPEMSGEEVLERLQDEQVRVPPIIALSAYLDETTRQKCRILGAAWVIDKPYNAEHLSQLAMAIANGAPSTEKVEFNEGVLNYVVKRREASLQQKLVTRCEYGARFRATAEPLLVVARRWNSWYPSIFSIIGGAYAIVGGGGNASSAPPVAVIDPGFQFMRAFTELGLPWQDLDTCVITHNHPDHMGGLFELMAARHALGKRTKLLCSRACIAVLGDRAGYNFEMKEIDVNSLELIPAYEDNNRWRRVRIVGFDTAHEEIGHVNSSKGLSITCEMGPSKASLESTTEVVILGDTEYDRAQHRSKFVPIICRPSVKVAVLHIGSCQLKQGTGKHLYLTGLKKILSDMDGHLQETHYGGRLLVIVSEWGLEHATAEQIRKISGGPIPGFNDFCLITEAIRYLQRDLEKILLLAGDIGLVVGMESGCVYLPNGARVFPHEVVTVPTDDGLDYEQRTAAAGN